MDSVSQKNAQKIICSTHCNGNLTRLKKSNREKSEKKNSLACGTRIFAT